MNSGTGSRMGNLTSNKPKAFVKLSNGESIISRQVRILKSAGITKFLITTGPYSEFFYELPKLFPDLSFEFIQNDKFSETNNIYSIHLLPEISEDVIFLHGDLVFDKESAIEFVNNDKKNIVVTSTHDGNPDYKDFLGLVDEHFIKQIDVKLQGSKLVRVKPFFKLENHLYQLWKKEVDKQVREENLNIYGEVALSTVLSSSALDTYDGIIFMEEVDSIDDLKMVNGSLPFIDSQEQETRFTDEIMGEINLFLTDFKIIKPFIVHGKHLFSSNWFSELTNQRNFILFSKFEPNPDLNHILDGLSEFIKNECDGIIAIGGGSCIDVAKAIKLASDKRLGIKNIEDSVYVDLPLMAIPTTAGSGSEATRYSVYYKNGIKQSLSNQCLLPDRVVLSSMLMFSQPDYIKKSALLDALSQAVETAWSISATEKSIEYSIEATNLIVDNYKNYFNNDKSATINVMIASNLAGKAINITATTAPHAFSYGITKNSSIAHGHAVSICLLAINEYSILHRSDEVSQIERSLLFNKFNENTALKSFKMISTVFKDLLKEFGLKGNLGDLETNLILRGLNLDRLENHPIKFDTNGIHKIIKKIIN
jgi:alcohol dehydrogenase class IV/choline kinase